MFLDEEIVAEHAAVKLFGLSDEGVPAGQLEGGFVAEVVVLAGDRAVNLEGAVLEEAEGWADGVGDAGVLYVVEVLLASEVVEQVAWGKHTATNTVFSCDQIATSDDTKSR